MLGQIGSGYQAERLVVSADVSGSSGAGIRPSTQVNYTYTDATGQVPDGGTDTLGQVGGTRTIALPATSQHTVNAVLGTNTAPSASAWQAHTATSIWTS